MKVKGTVKKPIFKRWWFWAIVVFLVLGAYGSTQNSPSKADPSNALMEAKVKTEDVMNGFGTEIIGQRAYITMSKSDLIAVSPDAFSEFVNTRVADSGYNWWSVVCDDGTGLFFAGSRIELVEYGVMDTDGTLTDRIGLALMSDGGEYTEYTYSTYDEDEGSPA